MRASLRNALSLRINSIVNPALSAIRSAFSRSSSRKGSAQWEKSNKRTLG